MRRIKTALIGLNENSHSIPVYNVIKRRPEIFEVAGVVLPEGEAEKYPKKFQTVEDYPQLSLKQVLEDPTIEAVVIETDEIHLTRYALLAAEYGKHIHMEKPGGVSLADFEKLIAAMKKTGKVFHTGYMYRYNPVIRDVMERIRNGELGDIISVEAQMNCCHPVAVRQWLQAFPGGMMFYLGCHLIDLILQLQGQPERIIPLNKTTGVDGVCAQDFGMAVLEYKNGVSFAKTYAGEYGGYMRRQLVITGTKETVELKPLEYEFDGRHCTDLHRYDSRQWQVGSVDTLGVAYDRYEDMMVCFAQYVAGEKENPYTYDYELELFKTLRKACGAS